MLDKPWNPGVYHTRQTKLYPVVDRTYWPMLASFNKWNIIQFKNKITSIEDFDETHKVVLDGIIVNVSSLVQTGKHGAINTTYNTTMGYYVIKYVYDDFTLEEVITLVGS